MTANQFYRRYLEQLQNIYNLQEASIITEWIFDTKAALKKKDIITNPEQELDYKQSTALADALNELLQHKPVQYVLGESWFYHLKFAVNEQVLIPRPETEELVQWIITENKTTATPLSILDIGTGSGCIAVALKKNMPAAHITAIDISKYSLALAKENAASNNTEIIFLPVDFLIESTWEQLPAFDIIVSNPPYIPVNERNKLDKNVTGFEPHTALFVPDDRPLLFYEKIRKFAAFHLNKNGTVYVETHEDFAQETATSFAAYFNGVEIRKDIFGKERMIKATHYRKQKPK